MIDLEVYDLKHLNAIIAQLKAKDVVAQGRAGERVVPRKFAITTMNLTRRPRARV